MPVWLFQILGFRRLVLIALLASAGCHRAGDADQAEDVKLDLVIQPDPPRVGAARITIVLKDREGQPVRGATPKLEGNMNHAGMEPVFADAREVEPGRYEAATEFTMGGDWFILVNATLADGRKLSRKVDIRGVKSK
jgi:Cu(I)/Ag(I) efflux system membrane fusion protein